jgi:hypothetical protein
MDPVLKAKYDKLLFELKYLEAELEYHNSVLATADSEFKSSFYTEVDKRGVREKLAIQPKTQEEIRLNRAQRRAKKKASKAAESLYKQIANKTHPDKLLKASEEERAEKEKKFLEANDAKEEDNILKLHSLAKELNIAIEEISEEQIALFEQKTSEIKKEIYTKKNTWIWAWYNAECGRRDSIMSKYLDHVLTNIPE